MTTTVDLRHELLELAAERDALRAQLEGDLPADPMAAAQGLAASSRA